MNGTETMFLVPTATSASQFDEKVNSGFTPANNSLQEKPASGFGGGGGGGRGGAGGGSGAVGSQASIDRPDLLKVGMFIAIFASL